MHIKSLEACDHSEEREINSKWRDRKVSGKNDDKFLGWKGGSAVCVQTLGETVR